MKKLLIILLLIVGCDYAPTEHTHEHEHNTTHEHDDIYGCTDSTSTNFDSSATIFNNTCEYPITEFAVDWILIKNAEYVREESDAESGIVFTYTGIGYTFLGTNSISNHNLNSIDIDGILHFLYESELYSFNLLDSYNEDTEGYFITAPNSPHDIINIYCYDNMSYCHIIQDDGIGYIFDLTSPFEIIDYR